MTNFSSDHETINDLQKLTQLIKQGLEQTWNLDDIRKAKQEVEQTRQEIQSIFVKFTQRIESVENNLQQIEANFTKVNLQKDELKKAIDVAAQLNHLIQQLGGTDKLKQDFAKLENLNEILSEIGKGKQVTESLQQQTQIFQQTTLETQQALAEIGKEFDKKESKLQSILNAITELSQSLGGETLVVNLVKKLTTLDDFIVTEKSKLSNFKKQLEEEVDNKFKDTVNQNQEIFSQKVTNLNDFIISAKSQINLLQEQLPQNLENQLLKLVNSNEEIVEKTKNELKEELRDEFQDLFRQEVGKLEDQYFQEINRLSLENKRMRKSSFKLIWPW